MPINEGMMLIKWRRCCYNWDNANKMCCKTKLTGDNGSCQLCPIKNLQNCVDSMTVTPVHAIDLMILEWSMAYLFTLAICGWVDTGGNGQQHDKCCQKPEGRGDMLQNKTNWGQW